MRLLPLVLALSSATATGPAFLTLHGTHGASCSDEWSALEATRPCLIHAVNAAVPDLTGYEAVPGYCAGASLYLHNATCTLLDRGAPPLPQDVTMPTYRIEHVPTRRSYCIVGHEASRDDAPAILAASIDLVCDAAHDVVGVVVGAGTSAASVRAAVTTRTKWVPLRGSATEEDNCKQHLHSACGGRPFQMVFFQAASASASALTTRRCGGVVASSIVRDVGRRALEADIVSNSTAVATPVVTTEEVLLALEDTRSFGILPYIVLPIVLVGVGLVAFYVYRLRRAPQPSVAIYKAPSPIVVPSPHMQVIRPQGQSRYSSHSSQNTRS